MGNEMVTVHGVLAGAYAGKKGGADAMLTHASLDGGVTALCKRVKEDHLADDLGETLTCPRCLARVQSLGLTVRP